MDNQTQPGKIMRGLQTPYIAVLNVFYFLTKWIGEKVRNGIVLASCFGLVIYATLRYSEIFLRDHIQDVNYRMLIICVLVALIAIFGMKEKAKPVAWNWPIVIFHYLLGFGILAARTHHGLATGYVLFALFLIFIIPAFGLVWTAKDHYRGLFDKLSFALDVIGIMFFIGSIIVWPYAPYFFLEGRYTGLTTNPNILAMFYLCVLVGACYLIYCAKYVKLSVVSLGCALAMLYLSESRTALLAAVVAVLALIISYIRNREADRIVPRRLLLVIILTIIIAFLAVFSASAPVKYFSYYGIESIKDEYNSGSKFSLKECEEEGIPVSDAGLSNDSREIQKTIPYSPNKPVEVEQIASVQGADFADRFHKGVDANTFGSRRLVMYIWVMQSITFWGVDRDEHPIVFRDYSFTGTHNTVLDFAYQCGALTGLWCFLLKLSAIILAIRFVFGKKEKRFKPGTLFAVMMILIFAVESTLEIQTLPSSRDITCYYYMMLPFVFAEMKRRKKTNGAEA